MPVYSHSRLSTFEQCPLKYKYEYVDRLDSQLGETVEAFMGTRVHETLEKLYKDVKHTKSPTLEELLAFYSEQWEKNWVPSIRIIKEYEDFHYRALGEKCITNYYKRYHPFDQDKTIETEARVEIDLSDGIKLQGFIDRIAEREDGNYEIHDYKTGGWLPEQEKLDKDRQLALYEVGVRRKYADVEKVGLVWHYLAFDKTVRSERTGEQLGELKKKTVILINEIEEAGKKNDFPARPSALCDWCDYRNVCPAKKHEYRVEGLPLNEFLNEPGVSLVNKYAELDEAKKKIEDSMEKLREAILAHAEREGETALIGSDHRLKIWSAEKLKFSGMSDDERARLDALLKASGRFSDYARVDWYALEKALENGELDSVIAGELRRLAKPERVTRLYLSRLAESVGGLK
jgi:putative RecB family exonuclease